MEPLAIVPVVVLVVAIALALRVDRRRTRRSAGIPDVIRDHEPKRHAVRGASLSQAIDAAFDAIEIKPFEVPSTNARAPSVEIAIDDAAARPPEHAKFDFSDTPDSDAFLTAAVEELSDQLLTGRTVAPVDSVPSNAFSTAEPTVTVVDDLDSADPIEELAAWLSGEQPAPLAPPRAARGSQAPIDRARTFRGDLRTALPRRPSSYITPATPAHSLRARTPS
jgi:hypothetical protein